jgi:predicted small secreted protein
MRTFSSHLAAILFASSSLASCTPAQTARGGFSDVTSSGAAVTSTDDGCTHSFLFDDFQIQRPASSGDAPSEGVSRSWTASLTAPAHVAGAQVSVDVRGALLGEDATGQLHVSFAGAQQTFELTNAEDFAHTFTAPAVEGANALEVTASLPAGSSEAAIQVDTVDLAVDGPSCGSGPD